MSQQFLSLTLAFARWSICDAGAWADGGTGGGGKLSGLDSRNLKTIKLFITNNQATLAAANTDVTITINAHGEVNVDQVVYWNDVF